MSGALIVVGLVFVVWVGFLAFVLTRGAKDQADEDRLP